MKHKEWFAILTESEIDRLETEPQIAVYRSIKSYSSNGTQAMALSLREIALRTKLSHVYVSKVLTQLTAKGFIEVVGEEKHNGGVVKVYKVLTQLTASSNNSFKFDDINDNEKGVNKGVNTVNSGVNTVNSLSTKVLTTDSKGVNNSGTKTDNIKRNNIREIIEHYLKTANSKERITPIRTKNINARLKIFTVEEIKTAINKCFADKFYSGDNDKGWRANVDWIFKNDENMDKLLNLKPKKPEGLSNEELEKRII